MNHIRQIALKNTKKLRPTVLDTEVGLKLPEAYKKFYKEWKLTPSKPVHYAPHTGPIWTRNETTGEVKRSESYPIPTRFPKELHSVFTGGELIVQGFQKKKKFSHRFPKFWVPRAYKSVIYSEILDKYLSVLMTKRAVELIHEHRGLDSYLLQTKAHDLKTMVALKLKQRLLLALSNKDLPYDEEKNNEIFKKYEQYLIPPEEIEWYGLYFTEACRKLKQKEEAEAEAAKVPLKQVYRTQLIQQLKEESLQAKETNATQSQQSLLSKIPGFDKFGKTTSSS